jgi:hypothetical protein
MKRLIIILAACALLITTLAAPTLGAAQKVALEPCGACVGANGGGFVVFNDTAGPLDNLQVTVALKGVAPGTDYSIFYYVDDINAFHFVGTVTTNAVGNATVHFSALVPSGEHGLAIDVTLEGSYADLYLSEGAYDLPMSPRLTFR